MLNQIYTLLLFTKSVQYLQDLPFMTRESNAFSVKQRENGKNRSIFPSVFKVKQFEFWTIWAVSRVSHVCLFMVKSSAGEKESEQEREAVGEKKHRKKTDSKAN